MPFARKDEFRHPASDDSNRVEVTGQNSQYVDQGVDRLAATRLSSNRGLSLIIATPTQAVRRTLAKDG